MRNKIIFYAASDMNIPKDKIGGAEAGAKRTYNLIKEKGFNILFIPKVTMYYGKIKFILSLIKTFRLLKKEFKNKEKGIFYITAFYKRQAKIEYHLIKMAHKNGYKVIYEPKNGSFVHTLINSKNHYRKLIKKTFNNVDCVFCQGRVYAEYINDNYNVKTIYIPNYVSHMDDLISICDDSIDLLYFGRVTKSKNIELIIDIFNEIAKQSKATLTIIGASDKEYREKLTEKIQLSSNKKFINFYDRMSLDEIKEIALKCDFFVFPSNEIEEGHSNSLTEAMSFGLVPIVSNAGFNLDVVGNEKYVVDSFTASEYAKKILELNNDLEESKKYSKDRISKNFTAEIVLDRQIEALKNI